MAKRRAPGRQRGREPGSGGRRAAGPGASEVAARLARLAESIDALPRDLVGPDAVAAADGGAASIEVRDRGLVSPGRDDRAAAARAVGLDAHPDPESADHIIVRLDGWRGHLELRLTRDRAALLVSRVGAALDTARGWYGPR